MKQITNEYFEECDKQLHKLRCLSQCSQNLKEINDCIKSDEFKKYVLSLLGVHAGVWSYVDITQNNKLFFLTENFKNNTEHEAHRNIEWPFLLSLETKLTCFIENDSINTSPIELVPEKEQFNNATNELISIARKYEAQLGIVPEPLKNLGLLASSGDGDKTGNFSKFERAEKLLYVPSGELLTAILGWSIFTQQLNDNLTFPKDLSTKLYLTETLEKSKVYKLLVHVLEQVKQIENNKLHLEACATISFLACKNAMSFNRDLSWGQVLCDLGLVKHIKDNEDSKSCSCSTENDGYSLTRISRLQTIAWWLIQQHESSCFSRPGLTFNLTADEANTLNSFIDNSGGDEFAWEILTMIFAILKRVKFDPSFDWESIYNFGLGPQQIWLRANAKRGWRWVVPYDWCCMQIMPELLPINNQESTINVPAGAVLLSLEAKAHYSKDLFETNFRRIRTLVLIFALVENRLTYVERIKNKANSSNYFSNAIIYWNRQFEHEYNDSFSELNGFLVTNEIEFEEQLNNINQFSLTELTEFKSFLEKQIEEINTVNKKIKYSKEIFKAYTRMNQPDGGEIVFSEIIKNIIDLWPSLLNKKELIHKFDFNEDLIIKSDFYLLHILLVNIITNAYSNGIKNNNPIEDFDILISIDDANIEKNRFFYLVVKNYISDTRNSNLEKQLSETYKLDEWLNYDSLEKKINPRKGVKIIKDILKGKELPSAQFKVSSNNYGYYFIVKLPIFYSN